MSIYCRLPHTQYYVSWRYCKQGFAVYTRSGSEAVKAAQGPGSQSPECTNTELSCGSVARAPPAGPHSLCTWTRKPCTLAVPHTENLSGVFRPLVATRVCFRMRHWSAGSALEFRMRVTFDVLRTGHRLTAAKAGRQPCRLGQTPEQLKKFGGSWLMSTTKRARDTRRAEKKVSGSRVT